VLEQVPLRKKDGGKVTGLPNKVAKSGGSGTDENPVNAEGKSLRPDPYGLDTESLVIAADGSVWMGEEYRPSIIHFSRDGRMIDRFVPQNSGGKKKGAFGVEALPEIYSSRRLNRGFEALAMKEGRLYAFPQSPLEPAASDANQARTKSRAVRVLQFDPQTQKATGEFVYLLDEQGDDRKLGDAIALPDGDFLVLEQTSDPSPNADKKLYRVSFDRATNLLAKNDSKRPVETLTAQEMQAAGVEAAQKTLVVDLVHMPGLEHYVFKGKLEGLAVIDPDTIAVVNDNDFGMFSDEKSELLLIRKKDLLKPPASSAP
jgi:3-phytase